MRRFGNQPQRGEHYRDRIGAYAIITRGDHILLTEETRASGVEIQLPGGGVDPGESPIQALHREIVEETGWRISNPRRLASYQRYIFMPEYNLTARKICLIYHAQAVRQISPPIEANHRAFWSDFQSAGNLPESPGDRYFLQAWLAGDLP